MQRTLPQGDAWVLTRLLQTPPGTVTFGRGAMERLLRCAVQSDLVDLADLHRVMQLCPPACLTSTAYFILILMQHLGSRGLATEALAIHQRALSANVTVSPSMEAIAAKMRAVRAGGKHRSMQQGGGARSQ
jgi:hypothetical protein